MAHLYVNSMAQALKDFHKNVLTADYNKYVEYLGAPTDSFYEALSWMGLRGKGVKEYADLSDEQKALIDNELLNLGYLTKTNPCE